MNREIITAKAKKNIREPLLYLLPLLALAWFWIIPEKLNISDVVLTVDGQSYAESLPLETYKIKEHSNFSISFNIVRNNKYFVYYFYPDDCILSIEINGKTFPQEMIKEPCAQRNGIILDLSEYIQKGLNRIDFQIRNNGGPGGLRIENLHSAMYRYLLFFALLLAVFVFVLKKFKLSNETILACVLSIPFVIMLLWYLTSA
jgi:hypothetical protein